MMAKLGSRNKKSGFKNKKNKIHLVFDEEKRKEFLTGFHKRKLQRKKAAKDKLDQDLKLERKRLKLEAKESYKKLVVSHRSIPELENLISEEYEDGDATVKILELEPNELYKQNHFIGANQQVFNVKEESDSDVDDEHEENSESNYKKDDDNEIPGMEFKRTRKIEENAEEEDGDVKREFQTGREVKKYLKKEATRKVKKSKVLQKKNKIESQKQKKKSRQLKKQRIKQQEKKNKKRR